MTVYPVVLAGGSGTRLWPLSRELHPKQFLSLVGQRSMVQDTLSRLDDLEDVAPPVVVCNEAHRFLLMDQTRELGKRPAAVIIEPVGRNTAPALTLAALRLTQMGHGVGPDPLMLVAPADHVVRDVASFKRSVSSGTALAASGYMVTFGVAPDSPETGYGYIRRGEKIDRGLKDIVEGPEEPASPREQGGAGESIPSAYAVSAFVEKPDREAARAYLEGGDHLWNSGIFMMRASVWLSELERYRPDIARACSASDANGHFDGDFFRPGAADFISCPSDSIDYAVLERAAGAGDHSPAGTARWRHEGKGPRAECAVVPLDAGWSDIGTWTALWEEAERDSDGNVIQGDVLAESTRNALLIAHSRLLAAVGMDDVVVVETADAVLVARKDRVQEVKEIVQRLKSSGRTEHKIHRKVHRPWGSYEIVDSGRRFLVKRLTVNPGAALSLQAHHHRAEHWVVVSGTARVTRGDEVFTLSENQSTYVPISMKHRLENPGEEPLEIIEVGSGSYLGEDDIVRFHDNYNRHKHGSYADSV